MNFKKNIIIRITLITCAVINWFCLLETPKVEYDLNYALLLYGFIFSIFVYFIFSIYCFIFKRKDYKKWLLEFVIYSIIGSPFTFYLFFEYGYSFFNFTLKG